MNPKSYVGCASMYDCADFFIFVSSFFARTSVSPMSSSVDVVAASALNLFFSARSFVETPPAANEVE